jgi:hypothetical protein
MHYTPLGYVLMAAGGHSSTGNGSFRMHERRPLGQTLEEASAALGDAELRGERNAPGHDLDQAPADVLTDEGVAGFLAQDVSHARLPCTAGISTGLTRLGSSGESLNI